MFFNNLLQDIFTIWSIEIIFIRFAHSLNYLLYKYKSVEIDESLGHLPRNWSETIDIDTRYGVNELVILEQIARYNHEKIVCA